MKLTADEIVAATGGRLAAGPGGATVHSVGTDSRRVEAGSLFVALRGERFDAHEFAREAAAAGAGALLVEREIDVASADVAVIVVGDSLRALGDLAAAWRARFDVPVVAITGSNGKTTTKDMLRSVLEAAYGKGAVLATKGNFNNLIGMPLTLLRLRPQHRAAVVEMGMNAPGEIARLTEIARPTVGAITCVGAAHLEGLGSIEAIARAKAELYRGLPDDAVAVVNVDDPLVRAEAAELGGERVDFGDGGDPSASAVEAVAADRVSFSLGYASSTAAVVLPIGGRHNVTNALAAAGCARALGVELDCVVRGLESFTPPPMRLAPRVLDNGVLILNDAYNANPSSFDAALDTLTDHDGGRHLVVLGDMLELGDGAESWHRRAGRHAAERGAWMVVGVGEHAESVCAGADEAGLERAVACTDHEVAAGQIVAVWRRGDAVLVKGSRGSAMERVVEALEREAGAK